MAENKTKQTNASVADYFAAIADETRRKDCEALSKLITKLTKEKPKMWGQSIVGFGSYHYKYESGREGDACITGFSSRSTGISVYLTADFPTRDALLAKLGKHKMAKACLTVKTLADVDVAVLGQLIAESYAARKQRNPALA
jgi:hypothetical protein